MKLNIKALSCATSATIVLVMFMTLLTELSSSSKAWFSGVTGHHWTTKSVFSVVFFALAYFARRRYKKREVNIGKEAITVTLVALISAVIIFLFFVLHFTGVI